MSQNTCGACGAVATGGRFCSDCGSQVTTTSAPVDATVVRPISSPPVPGHAPDKITASGPDHRTPGGPPPVPPPPAATGTGTAPSPTVRPDQTLDPTGSSRQGTVGGPATSINSFGRLSASDLARDGVALVAAFTVLGATWDSAHRGGDRWWVVIAVLLTAGSLAVPYLQRARLLGPLGASEARALVLAMNVPALASIVAAVINALAHAGDDFEGGVGGGVVLLTAAAVLAVQPRQLEPVSAQAKALWTLAGRVLGAAAVLVAIGTTVVYLVFADEAWFSVLSTIGAMVYLLGGFLALFVLPWVRALTGAFAGWVALVTVGAAVLVTELLAVAGGGFTSQFALPEEPVTLAMYLLVATAAAFASRPLVDGIVREHPVTDWVLAARLCLGVAALGCLVTIVLHILSMVYAEAWSGSAITVAVLFALVGLACLLAGATLRTDAGAGRSTAVLMVGLAVVAGIVAIAVGNASDGGQFFDWRVVASVLALPGVAIAALTVPRPVRQEFGPLYTPPAAAEQDQSTS